MAADRDQKREIERAAAAWLIRLGGHELDETERRAFRAWHDADPAHAAAFEAARGIWGGLGDAAAGLDAALRRRRRRHAALAAAGLAVVILGFALRPGADFSTAYAALETVTLADGSRMTLDGNSAADVAMAPDARRVALRRGRAFFDVVPDADRPFVVAAGTVETAALGTAFAVDRQGDAVSVVVERGRVAVRGGGAAVELAAGEAITAEAALGAPAPVALAAALAWRRGLMIFEDRSLGEVAGEFERATGTRIVIPQAAARDLRLSGVFRQDDPSAVLDAIESGLGLRILRLGVAAVILR